MKIRIIHHLKPLLQDRYLVFLAIGIVVVALAFSLYVGFNIRITELQVVSHYSAFGGTNFYRDRWFYLIGFIGFALLVAASHIILMGKLYLEKDRHFAIVFGWATLLLLVIATFVVGSILQIAQLS